MRRSGESRRETSLAADAKAAAVWVILALIWGSTWLFIKLGLQDLEPFTFAAIRFAVAIVAVLPVVLVRKVPLPGRPRDWLLMAGTGVLLFGVTYALVFWGEQYISSGLAALLFGTFPLFGLMIAHFHLPTERMTWSKLAGVVLGIGGVALVLADQLRMSGAGALWGSVAIVVAAAAAAYADVLVKVHGGHLDPAVLTLVQMVAGLIPLGSLALIWERDPRSFQWTAMAIVAIIYLAVVGTAFAFVLLYWLIKHMAVTKTMLITLVTPLVAVLLGVVLLGEAITWRVAIGGGAIVLGLGLVVWEGKALLKRRLERILPIR